MKESCTNKSVLSSTFNPSTNLSRSNLPTKLIAPYLTTPKIITTPLTYPSNVRL